MKKMFFAGTVLSIAIVLQSCTSVHLTAAGYDKTASMTSSDRKFTIVKHFQREEKCLYALLNLIPLTEPDVAGILREETVSAHGDAVINISIQGQTKFLDIAVPFALGIAGSAISPKNGVLTGLLIGARTYTIEGDVIQYTDR
jgi:hypothetical protein